ncbi:MAG: hypothetical protein JKY27_06370 [Magnetovibrio sp.]|nr:hypothetical protein [Magnetovibrio sp.]
MSIGVKQAQESLRTVLAMVETSDLSEWLEDRFQHSERPDLGSAEIIVSGGRGVGSKTWLINWVPLSALGSRHNDVCIIMIHHHHHLNRAHQHAM